MRARTLKRRGAVSPGGLLVALLTAVVVPTWLLTSSAVAQGPPLLLKINEVNREDFGDSPEAGSYIELVNPTDGPIDLSDYRLADENAVVTVVLADVSLSSAEHWVVCDTSGTAVPSCDQTSTGLLGVAESDVIELQFDLDGSWVIEDSVSFSGPTPAPRDGISTWSTSTGRLPDGLDTDDDEFDFELGCLTPGVRNVSTDGCLCGNDIMNDGESCDDGPDNASTECGCQLDCQLAPIGSSCGDSSSSACDESDSCDGAGVCQPHQAEDGSSCSNGLFCDGVEMCSEGACVTGSAPCEPGQSCDEGRDVCLEPELDAGPDAGDSGSEVDDVGATLDAAASDTNEVGTSGDVAEDPHNEEPSVGDVESDSDDVESSRDIIGQGDPATEAGAGEDGQVANSDDGCGCTSAAASPAGSPSLLCTALLVALRRRIKRCRR